MQVAGDTLQHHDVQFGERNKRHIFHTWCARYCCRSNEIRLLHRDGETPVVV